MAEQLPRYVPVPRPLAANRGTVIVTLDESRRRYRLGWSGISGTSAGCQVGVLHEEQHQGTGDVDRTVRPGDRSDDHAECEPVDSFSAEYIEDHDGNEHRERGQQRASEALIDRHVDEFLR